MSKQLQRYDFGTLRDFRGPIQISTKVLEEIAVEAPPPPPPPTFSEDQLQMARIDAKKLGYNEGFMAGMAQAETERDTHTHNAQTALAAMVDQVDQVLSTYHNVLKQQSLQLSELALVVAKKVAGEALKKNSVDVIAALVVSSLPMLLPRPRVTIELHPDTLAAGEMFLMTYMAQKDYDGALMFRANPALGTADARIDWGTGLIERSSEALWNDVEQLLARIPLELELTTAGEKNG